MLLEPPLLMKQGLMDHQIPPHRPHQMKILLVKHQVGLHHRLLQIQKQITNQIVFESQLFFFFVI
jgi:hypothetical protein